MRVKCCHSSFSIGSFSLADVTGIQNLSIFPTKLVLFVFSESQRTEQQATTKTQKHKKPSFTLHHHHAAHISGPFQSFTFHLLAANII